MFWGREWRPLESLKRTSPSKDSVSSKHTLQSFSFFLNKVFHSNLNCLVKFPFQGCLMLVGSDPNVKNGFTVSKEWRPLYSVLHYQVINRYKFPTAPISLNKYVTLIFYSIERVWPGVSRRRRNEPYDRIYEVVWFDLQQQMVRGDLHHSVSE